MQEGQCLGNASPCFSRQYLANRKSKRWHFLRHSSKGQQPQSVAFTLYVEVVRLIQNNLDEPDIPT